MVGITKIKEEYIEELEYEIEKARSKKDYELVEDLKNELEEVKQISGSTITFAGIPKPF